MYYINLYSISYLSAYGVYPRLNDGYRRFPPTNRLREFINDCRQALGGDKPRHYNGNPVEQVKTNWD